MATTDRQSSPVALIGAPTDVGAGRRGASMGPEALRVAGLDKALRSLGRTVVDRGDVSGPRNPEEPRSGHYRHLTQVGAWCRGVHDAVSASLAAGEIPLLMGGDHCLAIGSVAAVARHCREQGRPLALFWLDAHADFNVATSSPSGNIHGMPVSIIAGHGPPELVELSGAVPILPANRIVEIGIRSWSTAAWWSTTCAASTSSECARSWIRRSRTWRRGTCTCT
jgi:arginase